MDDEQYSPCVVGSWTLLKLRENTLLVDAVPAPDVNTRYMKRPEAVTVKPRNEIPLPEFITEDAMLEPS